MGRAEFWNDLVPAALLSVATFPFLVGVILVNVHWTPWAYSKDALILYGLSLFLANVTGMIFLGFRAKDDRFVDSIKLGSTVSALLIAFSYIPAILIASGILPWIMLAQALSQILSSFPGQTQPKPLEIPPAIIQTLGAYFLGVIGLSLLGAFIGALLSILLDKFQFEFKVKPKRQEKDSPKPEKPKHPRKRRTKEEGGEV